MHPLGEHLPPYRQAMLYPLYHRCVISMFSQGAYLLYEYVQYLMVDERDHLVVSSFLQSRPLNFKLSHSRYLYHTFSYSCSLTLKFSPYQLQTLTISLSLPYILALSTSSTCHILQIYVDQVTYKCREAEGLEILQYAETMSEGRGGQDGKR